MTRALSGRVVAALAICASILVGANARANALSDAWSCAKDTVKSGYYMATKGAKAVEVLGTSPQCVAQALLPDVPLLGISGAMIAINAVDSQLLPASDQCQPKLKTTAVQPVATILDSLAGGLIPPVILEAATAEAQNALWNFMSTTPPFSEITQRAGCGCTFMEAGISVETVKEILSTIGKAAKSCDKLLENVPGYTAIRSVAKAGAYEINNALEGVLVDQTKHKPPQDYYLYDFGGHPRSYDMDSHAVQMLLDPNHDPTTQPGATLRWGRFVKSGDGAHARDYLRAICVNYFDEHTMSESNASKVCSGFVAQFKTDVTARSRRVKAINGVISGLAAQIPALANQARSQCNTAFQGTSTVGGDNEALFCRQSIDQLVGSLGPGTTFNPFDTLNGLGFPEDPDTIKALLAGTSTLYYAGDYEIDFTTGVFRHALDALMSRNLDDAANIDKATNEAVTQARATFQVQIKSVLAQANERGAVLRKQQQAKDFNTLLAEFMADVKSSNLAKCPALVTDACWLEFYKAWVMCVTKERSIYIKGEFPNASETAEINALRSKCAQGYAALATRVQDWFGLATVQYAYMGNQCAGLTTSRLQQCQFEQLAVLLMCVGGMPSMPANYMVDGKIRQQPAPLANCGDLNAQLSDKWQADEQQIAVLATARTKAMNLCAGLPEGSTARNTCQQRVTDASTKCTSHIRSAYDTLVPPRRILTSEFQQALTSFKGTSERCQQRVVDQATDEVERHAAPLKAIQLYSSQCPSSDAKGNWPESCKTWIFNAVNLCLNPTSPTSSGRFVSTRPASRDVPTPANLAQNTITLGDGLTLAANTWGLNNTVAHVMSMPIGALQLDVPASLKTLLYTADQLVDGCTTSIEAALDQFRRLYVKAWDLPYPETSQDAKTLLTATAVGVCTSSLVGSRNGFAYAYTCPDGAALDACRVYVNARVAGVASCTSSTPTAPVCTAPYAFMCPR